MRSLDYYDDLCGLYFSGDVEGFRKGLNTLTRKEICTFHYQIAIRLPGGVSGSNMIAANNIIYHGLGGE
jgi:hypothetical protein